MWWAKQAVSFVRNVPRHIRGLYLFCVFFFLLCFFMIDKLLHQFTKIPLLGKLLARVGHHIASRFKFVDAIVLKISGSRSTEINRLYLINLALKNLLAKKTRSLITIFGMSVGVGIIVLLLSLGYGVERLIISKVATLDELKYIDVSTGGNTALHLDSQILRKINKLAKVTKATPITSLVGRISYNRATTDVLVYAAPQEYLDTTSKLIKGKTFAFNSLADDALFGTVAGESTEIQSGSYSAALSKATTYFNILPDTPAVVWSDCSVNDSLIGYTVRIEGGYGGKLVWGNEYSPFYPYGRVAYDAKEQLSLGLWVRALVPVFDKMADGKMVPILESNGRQKWQEGCLTRKSVQITSEMLFREGTVLGEATGSGELMSDASASASIDTYETVGTASSSGGLEFVQLQATESAKTVVNKALRFSSDPSGEAIVSSGFLSLLDIPLSRAVGTTFKSVFIISQALMPEVRGKAITEEVSYRIVGVQEDAENSFFYIPFADIQRIGVHNYSQLKIAVENKDDISSVRKQIETLGFRTSSTVDTVKQIESLFANLRLILGMLGLVALAVASLGMFNTLTVSLLERTREIGGMKTMGMVSSEVQDLFLAEAMIMGFSGGIGGLILGYVVGQSLSILISLVAITRGTGFLQLTYVPPFLTIFILISSFVVGVVTGLYPARRAKKISALNALRYE